jgi:hypothetical protein
MNCRGVMVAARAGVFSCAGVPGPFSISLKEL